MNLNRNDILEWETALYDLNMKRVYGTKNRKYAPKRLYSKRYITENRPVFWWTKECKKARKLYQRSFRRKMNENIHNEAYYHIRPRDYKTYGWLTW